MRNTHKAILYLAVIIGCAAFYVFPKLNALYVFVSLVILAVYIIAKNRKENDKKFLITVILLMFVSRFLLSLFVMNWRGVELGQDEGLYSKKALMAVYKMKDEQHIETVFGEYFDDYDMTNKGYGYNAYTYILALFYFLFGYQIQAVRLINILLSILVFLFIFYISKELFDSKIAKISSTIFAFFPSIALWSVMIGVDMLVLLCVAAYIFALIKTFKKVDLNWLCVMAIAIFTVNSIRKYAALTLVLVTLITLIYKMLAKMTKNGRVIFLLLASLIILILAHSPLISITKTRLQEVARLLIERQKGIAEIDDSGYLIYPEHCYQGVKCNAVDFFKAYMKGMAYVLFSPFPWRIESKLQLMAYPQSIFCYFMLPFIIYGFYIGYKKNKIGAFLISSYSLSIFSLFALTEGNIGALFRHRDMVTPFLIIYFSAGAYDAYQKRRIRQTEERRTGR